MAIETLKNMLVQLHKELVDVNRIDDDLRDNLLQIHDDLENLLNEPELLDAHHRNRLIKRLKRVMDDFETSHPELTITVGAIADSLSRMGI